MSQQQKLTIPGQTNPLDFTITGDSNTRISNLVPPTTIERFMKLVGSPNAYIYTTI